MIRFYGEGRLQCLFGRTDHTSHQSSSGMLTESDWWRWEERAVQVGTVSGEAWKAGFVGRAGDFGRGLRQYTRR